MKKGSKPNVNIEIVKVKNGRATVIRVFGKRYVLDMKHENRRGKRE